jgi:type IV secretory pathway VirB9-like protein
LKNILALLLAAATVVSAGTKAKPQTGPPPVVKAVEPRPQSRTVLYGLNDVITVQTRIGFTTLIVLPSSEEIIEATCGDQENWIINAGGTNLAHVKPTREGSRSNLNLISKTGTVYSFVLTEVSKERVEPDLKLFVSPKDGLVSQKVKYVSADELKRLEGELQGAKTKAAESKRVAEERLAEEVRRFRSEYPLRLNFDYAYERGSAPFNVTGIFSDGKFTYIAAKPVETGALYELKDGKPSLIEFQFRDGRYIVPKVLERGYLATGKRRLAFERR